MSKKLKANPIEGYILIDREEDCDTGKRTGDWYIAWYEVFTRQREAYKFARDHQWQSGYRVVRGSLSVTP